MAEAKPSVVVLDANNECSTLQSYLSSQTKSSLVVSLQNWSKKTPIKKCHSAVLIGGSNPCFSVNPVANFVESGGCAIFHSWCLQSQYQTFKTIKGSRIWKSFAFNQGTSQNFQYTVGLQLEKDDVFNDITNGINISYGAGLFSPNMSHYRANLSQKESAISVMKYTDGTPFLAYQKMGKGLIITLNYNLCNSYINNGYVTNNFWQLLGKILVACARYKDTPDFEEIFSLHETFQKAESKADFTKCVDLLTDMNAIFKAFSDSADKRLKEINRDMKTLQVEKDELEKKKTDGEELFKSLSDRLEKLRGAHERNFHDWNAAEVSQWLTSIDAQWSSLTDALKENEITGELLPDLTDAELKTVGVKKLKDRRKILKAIHGLTGEGEGSGTGL